MRSGRSECPIVVQSDRFAIHGAHRSGKAKDDYQRQLSINHHTATGQDS